MEGNRCEASSGWNGGGGARRVSERGEGRA